MSDRTDPRPAAAPGRARRGALSPHAIANRAVGRRAARGTNAALREYLTEAELAV
jgi:hypothetical protein